MQVELKNLIDFINNPPQALVEVYREDGLTDEEIIKMLADTEIIVTSFYALTKNRMLRATERKPKIIKSLVYKSALTLIRGGKSC